MIANPPNPVAAFFEEVCLQEPTLRRRGLQRGMRLYRPASMRALDALRRQRGRLPALATIYRERRARFRGGSLATVVLGGFVPDATEALHCQRRLLRAYGDVYYVNYPRDGFDREALHAQLADLLVDLGARGESAVLFGISFGCGLLGDFLAEERLGAAEHVAGVLWVSPVLSVEDLTGPLPAGSRERGACSLVGRVCLPMLDVDVARDGDASVRNGRRFFGKLFTAGSQNRRAMRRLRWRRQGVFLKERILETVAEISSEGARQRLALLRRSCPLAAGEWPQPLSARPALAIFAEQEDAVLSAAAPVRRLLATGATDVLPRVATEVARSGEPGDTVQHASLIFHSYAYNPAIERFYDTLRDDAGVFGAGALGIAGGSLRRLRGLG